MIVYIVTNGIKCDLEILRVFLNKDNAEKYAELTIGEVEEYNTDDEILDELMDKNIYVGAALEWEWNPEQDEFSIWTEYDENSYTSVLYFGYSPSFNSRQILYYEHITYAESQKEEEVEERIKKLMYEIKDESIRLENEGLETYKISLELNKKFCGKE